MAAFVFRHGEPVVVDLVVDDAEGDDPADYTVTMVVRSRTPGTEAPMSVAFVPAAGALPAYWRGTLYPVYRTGRLLVEAKVMRDGRVVSAPDAKIIEVRPRVEV